jgi:DnaK suppressor protein
LDALLSLQLDPDYQPMETEPYMNPQQLSYYRLKLLNMLAHIETKLKDTRRELAEKENRPADMIDYSDLNAFREMKINACYEYREMADKVRSALRRIEDGTYGYCQETGEEIGLRRLETLPYTPLSVDAQQLMERQIH